MVVQMEYILLVGRIVYANALWQKRIKLRKGGTWSHS